jgi:hypothetical protein
MHYRTDALGRSEGISTCGRVGTSVAKVLIGANTETVFPLGDVRRTDPKVGLIPKLRFNVTAGAANSEPVLC